MSKGTKYGLYLLILTILCVITMYNTEPGSTSYVVFEILACIMLILGSYSYFKG